MSKDIELKSCPFCGGKVSLHEDDMGGAWVSHNIKHKDGSKDPCILTGSNIDFYATGNITWNTRTGEKD